MSKRFLKAGVPILCAIPVAAGLATMGFSAATSLTGNMNEVVNFAELVSGDVIQSSNFYIEVESNDWAAETEFKGYYVETYGDGDPWVTEAEIQGATLTPTLTTPENPKPIKVPTIYFELVIQFNSGLTYENAVAGDTIGAYFDITLRNQMEKDKTATYKNVLFSFTQMSQQRK